MGPYKGPSEHLCLPRRQQEKVFGKSANTSRPLFSVPADRSTDRGPFVPEARIARTALPSLVFPCAHSSNLS